MAGRVSEAVATATATTVAKEVTGPAAVVRAQLLGVRGIAAIGIRGPMGLTPGRTTRDDNGEMAH